MQEPAPTPPTAPPSIWEPKPWRSPPVFAISALLLSCLAAWAYAPARAPHARPLIALEEARWAPLCAASPDAPPPRGGGAAPPSPGPPRTGAIASGFTRIYDLAEWGRDGEGSGWGSTLQATRTTRLIVELLIHRHGVTRLLDAPCGSSHWWPPLLARIRRFAPCFVYHGVDVVPSVIAASSAEFADDPRTTFAVADLAGEPLPSGGSTAPWDLVLCRDALQHLPLLSAIAVLENIARARPRFLAVGSYLEGPGVNSDVSVGSYFLINLRSAPFNLSGAVDVFDEQTVGPSSARSENKFLLLFTGEYLASVDWDAVRQRAAPLLLRGASLPA